MTAGSRSYSVENLARHCHVSRAYRMGLPPKWKLMPVVPFVTLAPFYLERRAKTEPLGRGIHGFGQFANQKLPRESPP